MTATTVSRSLSTRTQRIVAAAAAASALAAGAGIAVSSSGTAAPTFPAHATPAELAQYAQPDPVHAKNLQVRPAPPAPAPDPMREKSRLHLGAQ